MKKIYLLLTVMVGANAFAQDITFSGCPNLFETSNYVFTKQSALDAYGKGIYITSPVTGDQPCGGLGTCEFKIQWNNTASRWEFLADEGDGTFAAPYLIYYNSTGSASAANPPSNSIGTWVENIAVTDGECGGNLTTSNSNLSGDVHTTTLGINDINSEKALLFPNPVVDYITVLGVANAKDYQIYGMSGQMVKSSKFDTKINVKDLQSGVYQLVITTADNKNHQFRFIKK